MQRKYIKGGILHYNVGSQLKYYTELRIMIEFMAKDVVNQILELFKKPFSKKFFKSVSVNDESISSQARIKLNALTKKYQKLFASKAKKIAESMVINQQKLSQFNVKKSVEKVYPDVVIKGNLVTPDMEDIMRASIEANVELINSVPSSYMKDITGEVMRAITTGYGEQDIRLALEKYEGISKRKAKEIAQDQMRKAYTAANIQNIKELGMNKFCWVHSGGGQFPRESHVKMDGMIFSLDPAELIKEQAKLGVKPKDQGFPGYPINCGCIMQAVH
jgi:uncharacterized protein with gpF-like domain